MSSIALAPPPSRPNSPSLYRPLDEAALEAIVLTELEKLRKRHKAAIGKPFDFDLTIVYGRTDQAQFGGGKRSRKCAAGVGDGEVVGMDFEMGADTRKSNQPKLK